HRRRPRRGRHSRRGHALPAQGRPRSEPEAHARRLLGQRSRSLPHRPADRRRGNAPERNVRREARLARDEVPVEVHAGEVQHLVAQLGRAALLLSFALVAYALVCGSLAAWKRRRRLALSAQNALVASFATTLVAAIVLWVALARRD